MSAMQCKGYPGIFIAFGRLQIIQWLEWSPLYFNGPLRPKAWWPALGPPLRQRCPHAGRNPWDLSAAPRLSTPASCIQLPGSPHGLNHLLRHPHHFPGLNTPHCLVISSLSSETAWKWGAALQSALSIVASMGC
jgi:hypothetical protein